VLPAATVSAFLDELEKIAAAIEDPEELRKILKPGDILYTQPRKIDKLHHRLFYAVESRFQGSPYTHVGLYAGDGRIIDAGAWRKGRDESMEVHEVPLKTFTDRYKFKVLRVNASPEQRRDAVAYAKEQVGKPFNLKGMMRLVLPMKGKAESSERDRKDAAESFFCSELVANAYHDVGIAKERHLHHIMPGDIHRSTKTKTVAEYV
jgi:uncharacterized protein YycO